MRRRPLLLAVLTASLVPATAGAYGRHYEHPWLTRTAAEYLVATYPGQYDELLEYLDEATFGSADEDNFIVDGDIDPTTLRVMRHFYRPTDGLGLTYGGALFPSSYDWAAVPNEQNTWDWGDGLRRYREGDKAGSYETLGHIVHLIQDATVPAHTHLDAHGPPDGDDYEDYVGSRCESARSCDLPVPAPGTAIPSFEDPWEAWQATAWASYSRNLYPGDLSDQAAARGAIAEMFPDLSWSWFSETWKIGAPPVGSLGSDFFEDEPGLYYFKNAEHAAAIDKIGLGDQLAVNSEGMTMVQGFARDLIPIAILHTAAVMKLYLDQAYAQAPETDPEPDPDPAQPDSSGCAAAPSAAAGGTAPVLFVLFFVLVVFRQRRS